MGCVKRFNTDLSLVKAYAARLDIPFEDAHFLIREFVGVLADEVVNTGAVNVRKLGLFHLQSRRRIKFRHPKTGEEYIIPMKYYIKFNPASSLKNKANARIKDNMAKAYEIQEEKF